MSNDNTFATLLRVDVSRFVEKKGQFSYLSWPFAVSQLRLTDPTATWEVKRFNDLPYMVTELGYFVEVAVTVQGVTLSQIHPVLDARNRPIAQPSPFDINTSIQRCLVKAIALHGLGLNVYAGEDLPVENDGPADNVVPLGDRPQQEGEYINPSQLAHIKKLIQDTHTDEDRLLDYFGFFTLDTIPRSEGPRVIKALETKQRRAA